MSSRIDKSVGLEKAVKNLFVFESDDEKLNFKAEQLHLTIMIKIKELMDKKGWKKSDLAFALGVKKPFITKLFSAEKFLNIKMIAKIEEIFDVYFDINPVSRHLFDDYSDKNLINFQNHLKYQQSNLKIQKPYNPSVSKENHDEKLGRMA